MALHITVSGIRHTAATHKRALAGNSTVMATPRTDQTVKAVHGHKPITVTPHSAQIQKATPQCVHASAKALFATK